MTTDIFIPLPTPLPIQTLSLSSIFIWLSLQLSGNTSFENYNALSDELTRKRLLRRLAVSWMSPKWRSLYDSAHSYIWGGV